MNIKQFFKSLTKLEIILFVVFVIYIVLPIETPNFLVDYIDSSLGMLILFITAVYLFFHANPIIAVIFVFVTYELLRRTSQNKGKVVLKQYNPYVTQSHSPYNMNPSTNPNINPNPNPPPSFSKKTVYFNESANTEKFIENIDTETFVENMENETFLENMENETFVENMENETFVENMENETFLENMHSNKKPMNISIDNFGGDLEVDIISNSVPIENNYIQSNFKTV